jgi:hypothetical protein
MASFRSAGDALDAVECLLDGAGNLRLQVIELDALFRVAHLGAPLLPAQGGGGVQQTAVEQHDSDELPVGLGQEAGVVADELDRGVDFVGQAGREPAEGFQFRLFLGAGLPCPAIGDVARADLDLLEVPRLVAEH